MHLIFSCGRCRYSRRDSHSHEGKGFSLVELLITMAVILVISALAVPTLQMIRSANLSRAGSDYTSFLQNARVQAVQNDTYYPVISQAGPPAEAFLDVNRTGFFANGDPLVVFPSTVHVRGYADNPPALANLESVSLASSNDLSLDTTDSPTFGPRGLPCKPSGGVCSALSGPVSGTSYISFFQSEPDGTWLAVVVNPSARMRVFKYGSGTWSSVQ